jgi:hypothetical protein
MTVAIDGAHGSILAFGGVTLERTLFGGTSVWQSGRWSPQQPVHRPLARSLATMSFDASRSEFVLYGGQGSVPTVPTFEHLSDTWTWTHGDWQERTPVHVPSLFAPVSAYDTARQRVVLFGWDPGTYSGDGHSQTWEWNGNDWLRRPSGPELDRLDPGLAFDPNSNSIILFGGFNQSRGKFDDTWLLGPDGWHQKTLNSSPPARLRAPMGFDPKLGKLLLTGSDGLRNVWTWDGARWAKLQATSPFLAAPLLEDDHAGRLLGVVAAGASVQTVWAWTRSEWQPPG